MYGPSDVRQTETALLEPRRALQNVGSKDKDKDEDENRTRTGGSEQFNAFGADGFTFLDLLDIINPLQHIPVVSNVYRELSGDNIDPASRVIGGTLFGGPVGTVAALVNVSLEQTTGKDMGDHVIAFFRGDEAAPGGEAGPMLADASATGQLANSSLITDNLEVLNWAKNEATLSGGVVTAQQQAMTVPTATASGVSDATAHALRVAQRSGDVAGNVEVLDWARREAAAVRATVKESSVQEIEERGALETEQKGVIQAARNSAVQSLTGRDQLAGANAPGGGWFSETMVTAMATYEQSANLGRNNDPRVGLKSVDVSN